MNVLVFFCVLSVMKTRALFEDNLFCLIKNELIIEIVGAYV
jgi:hypothetical protein